MRYKKIVVPLFLFFFVILISLIAIDSDSIDNDKSEYIEMEGLAKICNNNPSPFAIVDMIKEMNRDDIIELSEDSDPCGLLFSGILSKGKIRGFEVENNLEDMVKYTEDAWKFGAVDAGYGLFGMYYTGGVVNQNKELALRYLIESATLGYIRSQRKLGIAYRGLALRDLVNKDESEAFKWFLMAAEQGDRPSATNVAAFLHEGEIVNKMTMRHFNGFLGLKACLMAALQLDLEDSQHITKKALAPTSTSSRPTNTTICYLPAALLIKPAWKNR